VGAERLKYLRWSAVGCASVIAIVILLAVSAFLVKRKDDIPMSQLQAKYGSKSSRYVRLRDNIVLHYRDEGNLAGPPVLLIHGLGGSSLSWSGWNRTLGERFHLYELDLPGHGLTTAPAKWRPSPEAYADTIHAFVSKLRLPSATVVGASFGGQVAWTYALRYPEQTAALVMISASGWPQKEPGALKLLRQEWIMPLLSRIGTRSRFEGALKSAYANPGRVTPEMLNRFADLSRAPGHRQIIFITTGSLPTYAPASEARLTQINAPTLILHGARDNRVPLADARRSNRAIKNSVIKIYPNAGHALADEFAGEASANTRDFLIHHMAH
jgi:pimeloyl-ACP methyl ester carboxylesterase